MRWIKKLKAFIHGMKGWKLTVRQEPFYAVFEGDMAHFPTGQPAPMTMVIEKGIVRFPEKKNNFSLDNMDTREVE